MDILIIVNESPWSSALAGTAQRFVKAAKLSGHRILAVFFHNDGVYNALDGRASDDGMPSPVHQWRELCVDPDTKLLLCSAASARRFDSDLASNLPGEFTQAGLARMWDIAERCDRVVTF